MRRCIASHLLVLAHQDVRLLRNNTSSASYQDMLIYNSLDLTLSHLIAFATEIKD